jgi:hypothetical protein
VRMSMWNLSTFTPGYCFRHRLDSARPSTAW